MTRHETGDDAGEWVRLPWDSDHFGFPIARLLPVSLSDQGMFRALRSVEQAEIRCLYWLSEPVKSLADLARRAGFKTVDVRVELETEIGSGPLTPARSANIRVADESDLGALVTLASSSHRTTRFYSDGGFPTDRSDALYAAWIERSFRDPAQVVYVCGPIGEPVAYIACGITETRVGSIGLVAVEESHRGTGLGSALVTQALRHLSHEGAQRVTVVTQGSNEAAQRVYARLGFTERHRFVWFHRWF